jgi:hypothetical protein
VLGLIVNGEDETNAFQNNTSILTLYSFRALSNDRSCVPKINCSEKEILN